MAELGRAATSKGKPDISSMSTGAVEIKLNRGTTQNEAPNTSQFRDSVAADSGHA